MKGHIFKSLVIRVDLVFLLLVSTIFTYHLHAMEIILPRENSPDDPRQQYFIDLIKLVFEKVQTPLVIKYSPVPMVQNRAIRFLGNDGHGITLQWAMTTKERENFAMPIRVPLLKGLLGARVCLVRPSEAIFSSIKDKTIVQGHDWPDTEILRANHFNVETSTFYDSLFGMVLQKHGDCFLRSITEVQKELASTVSKGLVLEKNYLIYYHAPMYFFVSKDNMYLFNLLNKGLSLAIDDGSFDKLFYLHYGRGLDDTSLNIKSRKIVRLSNPFLTAETPLADKRLWYSF